jgi:hypothetical protein
MVYVVVFVGSNGTKSTSTEGHWPSVSAMDDRRKLWSNWWNEL